MKRFLLIPLLLMCVPTPAQHIYVYPTAVIAPRGSYQTVTAVVTGVNNKTVTWTTDGGTIVGKNPCVVNEPCTVALHSTTAGTYHLTAASNANRSVLASSSVTFTASPKVTTGHPRLIVTAPMLADLQAKAANSATLVYQQTLNYANTYYYTIDSSIWAFSRWNGSACTGGSGPSTDQTGNSRMVDANYFAWLSMVAPTSAVRNRYGCAGRDIWTYVMTNILNGRINLVGNVWSDQSMNLILTGDWLMAGGYLSSADITLQRQYNAFMLQGVQMAWTNGTVPPVNTYNNPVQWSNPPSCPSYAPCNLGNVRATGNNYTYSRDMYLVGLGLMFDDNNTDDPTLTNNCGATRYQLCASGVTLTATATNGSKVLTAVSSTANLSVGMAVQPANLSPVGFPGTAQVVSWTSNTITLTLPANSSGTVTGGIAVGQFSAGSMHAYFDYFVGSLLYLTYANLEDPNVIQQAYNAAYSNVPSIPTCQMEGGQAYPCFGGGRGGEAVEGSYYQYAEVKLRYALNMLYTTGYNDPTLYGPQMSLSTSSWWDMKLVSDLEFLTGFVQSNGGVGMNEPSYSFLTTGDTLNYYETPQAYMTAAALATFDSYTGRTDRTANELWPMMNTPFGGPHGTSGTCSAYCGFDYGYNIMAWDLWTDLLIALPGGDPLNFLPSDPRPSLPTDLYNGSLNQHQMVRNNWTGANANSVFSYWASNGQINHEEMTTGAFSVYTGNEYIVKPRVVFNDYNTQMSVASQSNEMQVVNPTGSGANGAWRYVPQGGQWLQGQMNGIPTLYHSELPAYAADIVDNTYDYNGWYGYHTPYNMVLYKAIAHASRSLIYLRGTNQIVYADRAATTGAATAMSTNLTITGTPTISGSQATWPTRSAAQKGCFTSLLPAGGKLTAPGLIAGGVDQAGDWEPASVINLSAGSVPSTMFLSTLEWGASNFTCSTPTLVNSSAGETFSGALIGSSLVMFMRNWPGTLTSTTFPASGATSIYVSDLIPGTTYSVSGEGAPTNCTTDTAGVCQFSAAGTGNITVKRGSRVGALPLASQNGARQTRKIVFWLSLVGIFYTYVGYPLIVWTLARLLPRPWKVARITPSVSVVLAVHNGVALLSGKIQHLLGLDYPDIREIILVSDGSRDGTAELLADQKHPRLHTIILPEHGGKAVAVNAGVAQATADVVLFVDIRPEIDPGAIQQLVRNFADEKVGCVSGNLKLRNQGHDPASAAVGDFYWRYEQWLRTCEAITDSPVGVYGGFYAVRRELYVPQPAGIILDDMFQPLSIIRQGFRSVVDPLAFVYDMWPKKSGDEFQRKIRTLAGNFQLLQHMPWTLTPRNRLVFQFVSHKVMRLVVPYLLVLLLVSSIALSAGSPGFAMLAALQIVTWVLAIVGLRYSMPILDRITAPASALLVLNAAAVAGLYRFLFTRGPLWKIWHSGKPLETPTGSGEKPYREVPRPQGLKPS